MVQEVGTYRKTAGPLVIVSTGQLQIVSSVRKLPKGDEMDTLTSDQLLCLLAFM